MTSRAILGTLLALVGAPAQGGQAEPRPNLVFILTDNQGAWATTPAPSEFSTA